MAAFGMYVKMRAVKGRRDELVDLMLEAARLMSAVNGCILYLVHKVPDEARAVCVTEFWKTADAHARSLELPEVKALIKRARPLIAGIEQTTLAPIGGRGLGP